MGGKNDGVSSEEEEEEEADQGVDPAEERSKVGRPTHKHAFLCIYNLSKLEAR